MAVQSHLRILGHAAPPGSACAVHHPTLDLARPDLEVGLDVRHNHDRLAVGASREGRPRALPIVAVLITRHRLALGGMGLPEEAVGTARGPSLLVTGESGPGLLLALVQVREPSHCLDVFFSGVHFGYLEEMKKVCYNGSSSRSRWNMYFKRKCTYLLGSGREELIDRLVGDVMYDIVLGMAAVEDAGGYAIVEDRELPCWLERLRRG